jgi:hypothetical protein
MTNKIPIPFLALLTIAHAQPETHLPDEAVAALAKLCGVDPLDDISQQDALRNVQPHLYAQFRWLKQAGDKLLEIYTGHCTTCPTDHNDKAEFKKTCKVHKSIAGFKKLFGDPVMVEPLLSRGVNARLH